jgi:CheY-like chemotaxis protein
MGILVIDSDFAVRHPLAEYLRECGYEVFEAVDTREAAVLVTSHRNLVKVAICDVHSPGDRSGFEFAKWLRDQAPEIQLALAATPDRAAQQAAELCEDGPLLKKPYDHQLLLDRIKQLMARRDRGNKVE